jgi:hypothetical protein
MAKYEIELTDDEEAHLSRGGSTFEGIVAGLRTEWAMGIASAKRQVDLSRLAAVIDAPEVKAAVEAEEARQAEAQAGEGEK